MPNDLHMEHLNRLCKEAIKVLGPNKTFDAAITRVGKALGTISPALDNFDKEHDLAFKSHEHKRANFNKDLHTIVTELCKL